jgi:predicted DNA-binding transcriptional regulator YafY
VEVNLRAMTLWAIQYGPYVKVLTPLSLVEEVKASLEDAFRQYEDNGSK